MNLFYDAANARLGLNSYLARSAQENGEVPYLGSLKPGDYRVCAFEQPNAYRMISGIVGQEEELVVRIPGILCYKTLPPVTRPLHVKGLSHVRALRQFIRVTGLGSLPFDSLKENVQEVYQIFTTTAPGIDLQPLQFGTYEADFALDLHCRYFTERRFAPDVKHIPLSSDVDPFHILEGVRGQDFIHAPDNEVQYLQKKFDGDNQPSYEKCNPKDFREGDIVEASVSFVAYPLGNGKGHKLVMQLRSLALMTSLFREKAESIRQASAESARVASSGQGKRGAERLDQPMALKRRYFVVEGQGTTSKNDMMKM